MTTLSHLSPDVLEVVRDVAKQEDSFLLRAQSVPLRVFAGENAPRVGAQAAFLSSAERHLLEHCRDETAYLFELGLYFKLLREERADSILNRIDLNGSFAETFDVVRMPRAAFREDPPPMSALVAGLSSSDELLHYDWRTLAKFAMSLRVKTTTLSNVALGWLRNGQVDDSRSALIRTQSLRPGGWPDFYAILGHERFLHGAYDESALAYTSAWRLGNDVAHAACALFNHWLMNSKLDSDLRSFAESLDGARLTSASTWLRHALGSSLNRMFVPSVAEIAKSPGRDRWNHPAASLIMEVLQ